MTVPQPVPDTGEDFRVVLPLDFTAFHEMYGDAYERYSYTRLGSHADAAEVVDEAFAQLALDWHGVLSQPNAEAYAWAVVRNRVFDELRARARRPLVVDTTVFEAMAFRLTEDPIGALEDQLAVRQALTLLPDKQQDVILLRFFAGFTTKEAAELMGVSPATVRSHRRQAARRLAAILGPASPTTDLKGD
ncbi:sigma-70 family RNA polymerase sigma factor [Streptomyces sp. H10-C2]|uniref:RNA polymerase sigma factor n=1 Tax=unclassified Streptomyces TaxID=2593676 RepID=UPI0024BA74C5|nr:MULTISPECIES: sigma-70 family RNA polymerase sigma factor [unclassified Streptomyces]MDJ0343381.1 sigma-70 family RNA polymerase sigma factor [Streptomyces sp. PH10-H1]MDJ0371808.1 sigma-70 family RNA polymerase sigma factor [Streptomyces sp. H10-C2]